MSLSNWDIDFRDGALGENTVARLMSAETIEVKTDRRWFETGNVYIETDCWYQNDQRFKPSGLSVSKASHWAFVLEDLVLIVPIDILKRAVNHIGKPITCEIPPNPSMGVLIKITELLEYMAEDKREWVRAMAAYESYMEPEGEPSEVVLNWLNE